MDAQQGSGNGGGSFCSAGTVCDCASVIGNADWNTVPYLGLPWGLAGMLVFVCSCGLS